MKSSNCLRRSCRETWMATGPLVAPVSTLAISSIIKHASVGKHTWARLAGGSERCAGRAVRIAVGGRLAMTRPTTDEGEKP